MASQARKAYDVLRPQVGYKEGRDNWNKYAQETLDAHVAPYSWQNEQWCHIFQSWGGWKSGLLHTHYPNTAGCSEGVNWYRNRGWFSYYPAVGALVYFGSGGGDHVEFVYAYNSTYIYTIGGNTSAAGSYNSDGVYMHQIARREDKIYGYGVPAFAEGRISADPKWGAKVSGDVRNLSAGTISSKPVVHVSLVVFGNNNGDILTVQKALHQYVGLDYSTGPGVFGPKTQAAYDAARRKMGYSAEAATGPVGKESLTKLGNLYGFTVVS